MAGKSFESNIERLEAIVSKMESGDLSLDEALSYYEEGIKLSKLCYARLSDAEKKIEKLVKRHKDGDEAEFTTQPLDLFDESNPKNPL